MFSTPRLFFTALATALLVPINALAQQPSPTPSPSNVKTVEVTAPIKEAEVGQQVKLKVIAKDASGSIVNESPSTYFAGPFDIAAADDSGNVKLFGPGEVIAGAIVGGKPGFTTFTVKSASIKTVEINSIKGAIVTGGSAQLEALTRISSGDPRTGVPVTWTSDNPGVATVNAGGVVTGVGPG